MSWEEIYDEVQAASLTVQKNSVVLKTRNRIIRGKIVHYLFNLLLGKEVLAKLNWNGNTKLKFQWGKEDNLGLVRIAVILNDASGWKPRVYNPGYALISNKALPSNISKIEQQSELTYSIVDDPRESGLKLLEVVLPNNFYTEGVHGKLVPESNATPVDLTPEPTKGRGLDSNPPVVDQVAFLKDQSAPKMNQPKVASQPTPKSTISTKSKFTAVSETSSNLVEEKQAPLSVYDRAAKNGGPINIHDLCKWLRVFTGDTAQVINNSMVEINGSMMSYSKALAHANTIRAGNNKPIFSLTQ